MIIIKVATGFKAFSRHKTCTSLSGKTPV